MIRINLSINCSQRPVQSAIEVWMKIAPILAIKTLPTNWQSSWLNRGREQSGSHFVHFN